MKPVKFIALATWMVEHLTFGLNSQALSGDLLEELQLGRSPGWYWRQVLVAVAAGLLSRIRAFAIPLLFCALWTSLYPGWNFLNKAMLGREMPEGWTALAWPYSALLPLGYGMVPALTFVWFGFLVYVLMRPGILDGVTAQRLLCGLSASLNVLLVSTTLLLRHFRQSRVDLRSMLREDFYSAFHLSSISIPLALSLFAALCFTVVRTPGPMRRGRLPRQQISVSGLRRKFYLKRILLCLLPLVTLFPASSMRRKAPILRHPPLSLSRSIRT